MANNEAFGMRLKEWESMHPRQWVATTNRSQVEMFLSEQTQRVVEAQLEAADHIVVSQEGIAHEVNSLRTDVKKGLRDIGTGIENLTATFEWGFSELIWQLEQQNELLKEILETLQAPLDTEAKELRKRAEKAYQNEWIDDALEDFLESEKRNRYDFTVHFYIGNIYLFHKGNGEKALEYYEKAVKYASPEVPHYAAFALLHIGQVKYLQTDFQGACEATQKAIELLPSLYEAHYQHARYCATLGEHEEALRHLDIAIKGDRHYCAKASSEKDFEVVKDNLRAYFGDIQEKIQAYAKTEIDHAETLLEGLESYENKSVMFFIKRIDWLDLKVLRRFSDILATAKKKSSEAKVSCSRATIFDSWDALQGASAAVSLLKKHGGRLLDSINSHFRPALKGNMKWHIQDHYKLALRLVGASIGILFAGMITGVFLGASPSVGRVFLFLLTLLFFGGGLGYLLGLIGKQIGGKIVLPRRWKDVFGEQEVLLNKIEGFLAMTPESKKYEWKDVLLGGIADPEGVRALVSALSDAEVSVRWRAAQSLAHIGATESVSDIWTAIGQLKSTLDELQEDCMDVDQSLEDIQVLDLTEFAIEQMKEARRSLMAQRRSGKETRNV